MKKEGRLKAICSASPTFGQSLKLFEAIWSASPTSDDSEAEEHEQVVVVVVGVPSQRLRRFHSSQLSPRSLEITPFSAHQYHMDLGFEDDRDKCGNLAVDLAEKSEEEMLQESTVVEVNGVLEAVKSKCKELQGLVLDSGDFGVRALDCLLPLSGLFDIGRSLLPDALDVAAKVVPDLESNKISTEHLEENQNGINLEPSFLVDEGVGAVEATWDDDETSHEASSKKSSLRSAKKRVVTPVKKYEPKKIVRRNVKKWSSLEEETLRIWCRRVWYRELDSNPKQQPRRQVAEYGKKILLIFLVSSEREITLLTSIRCYCPAEGLLCRN
ncbi:hypothetical protein NE237_030433 [Protea cynaroides]|uniref:Uncharacterized protein n=1 Tax=Protea cynaroides TaxID=273540 RepID=A0A9Q0GT24_9MAGN|nr:hypothetical protein NE237_030433 [Protea cynaroides]